MKIQYLLLLFLSISCKKNKPLSQTANKRTKAKIEAIAVQENFLQTDTIILSKDKNNEITHVLIHLIEQKPDLDSIIEAKFRLDFYKNKNKIISKKILIKGYEKESEWSGSYGLTNSSSSNSSFIKIDLGYRDFGYTFENYLFYLKNNQLQLVHEWQSISDNGWRTWTEFVGDGLNEDPEIFYCKTVSFAPADDDSEDSGVLTYSDSISFSLTGNRWKKKLLSPRDEPYFEKKMSLNEFYK